MANALTGGFDAVLQVRVEAVNRILATLHQRGASKDASPSFLHSVATRVGDPPEVSQAEWAMAPALFQIVAGSVQGKQSPSKPSKEPPAISNAPPGISEAWRQAVEALTKLPGFKISGRPTRGTARVQLSTPRIAVAENSISTVTAHVSVRARYTPDGGTTILPEPIHGELQAAFSVETTPWAAQGKQILTVTPSGDDTKIQFIPAAGTLSGADAAAITSALRAALRNSFEPTNVELPKGFKFHGFKGLGSGASAVIAAPVDLSGLGLSGIDQLPANSFLKPGDHFAVAVSKEHVESKLKPLINQILAFKETISIEFWVPVLFFWVPVTFDYHVSLSSVTLTWQTGSIVLTVTGSATATWPAPDYSFTIEQLLTLDPASLKISFSDPSISGLPDVVIDDTSSTIKAQEAVLLQQVQSAVSILKDAATPDKLVKALDPSIASKVTSAEIQPDGLILRGVVNVPWRAPAEAVFTETGDGTGFTALKSWIPAGSVASFKWSMDAQTHPHYANPWSKVAPDVVDEHSFVVPIPKDFPENTRTCLTIEGTQVPSSPGAPIPVSETNCQYTAMTLVRPVAGIDVLFAPALPIWGAGVSADAPLESAIVAHVSALADRPSSAVRGAALVHFANAQSGLPLEVLGRALAGRTQRAALPLVIVLAPGSLRETRAAVERNLGSIGGEAVGTLAVTEDYERGWTRTFAVERAPATFLLNHEGEVVWRQTTTLDVAALGRAIDEHVVAGARRAPSLVRLAVKQGDPAPDVLFAYGPNKLVALRKLRGERVLLTFWKSWSAPCLTMLRELQGLHAQSGRRGPVIVAVGDGENAEDVAAFRREHNLAFTMAPDPTRRIARAYGVNCWPAMVLIDEQGVIERVRFGISSHHSAKIGRR